MFITSCRNIFFYSLNTEFLLPANHEQHRNTVTFESRFRIEKYKKIRKHGIKQDSSNSC